MDVGSPFRSLVSYSQSVQSNLATWEKRSRHLALEGREVRWGEGRKGVFGTLKTRRRLQCLRYALRGTEAAGVEAVRGGQCPASFAGQTSGERISQP